MNCLINTHLRFRRLRACVAAAQSADTSDSDVTGLERNDRDGRWGLLFEVVEAWTLSGDSLIEWCKKTPECPLEFHVNLICTASGVENARAAISDVQSHLCTLAQSQYET